MQFFKKLTTDPFCWMAGRDSVRNLERRRWSTTC